MVRRELNRLHTVAKTEKGKAENQGKTVEFDNARRCVIVNGEIVDLFKPRFFLETGARHDLFMMSLNINGKLQKLESYHLHNIIKDYDIICISELKTNYHFLVPGYKVIRSKIIDNESHRGGVAVLISHCIWTEVYGVISLKDQVWFKLHCMPDHIIRACYIPPSDSPYFEFCAFANIHDNVSSSPHAFVLGDLNARLGNLEIFNSERGNYTINPDTGRNTHGTHIRDICRECSMQPVNHFCSTSVQCGGARTFKQRNTWISQLDWALCTHQSIEFVKEFSVIHDQDIPSNLAPISIKIQIPDMSGRFLLERAKLLGEDTYVKAHISRKPIKTSSINSDYFVEKLPDPETLFMILHNADACELITETIYGAARSARERPVVHEQQQFRNSVERWQKLVTLGDPKTIWRAIDWGGNLDVPGDMDEMPSEKNFSDHFEKLLNPADGPRDIVIPQTIMNVPVLDDDISPGEVENVIKRLKPGKSAGPDGISPGILHFIPEKWIIFIACLFNVVFGHSYPGCWLLSKYFTIFKKGSRSDPGNYRGISIMAALAKAYHAVLNNRLCLWYTPNAEQAGAQHGRGCLEQILTIRLLIDTARKQRYTLYVAFIDYQKAYDKVNRSLLLNYLADKGCGNRFLRALGQTLQRSLNALGCESFVSTMGVRQGGPTSCRLFMLLIDYTIDKLRTLGPDGWLQDLHTLLLMDHTAVVASSRTSMERKLHVLQQTARDIGMDIHPGKSQFLTVNAYDTSPFILANAVVEHTDQYTYLGSLISNAPMSRQIADHMQAKIAQTFKFSSFRHKNGMAESHVPGGSSLVSDEPAHLISRYCVFPPDLWPCSIRAAASPPQHWDQRVQPPHYIHAG